MRAVGPPHTPGLGCSLRAQGPAARCMTSRVRYQPPSDVERFVEVEQKLKAAVEAEDFSMAAELRDRLRELQLADPVCRLAEELQQAVEAQDFKAAARLRDELAKLRPPPPPEGQPGGLEAATSSCASTEGVTVSARSFHMRDPSIDSFRFGYRIKITNDSDRTVRLMERHWIITSDRGQIREVRGPGVVGEQPVLSPGESYEYQSTCFLPTRRGTMQGHFEMYRLCPKSRQWTTSFLATIAQFGLRAGEEGEEE